MLFHSGPCGDAPGLVRRQRKQGKTQTSVCGGGKRFDGKERVSPSKQS